MDRGGDRDKMEFIDDSIEVLDELERYRDSFVMVEEGFTADPYVQELLLKAVKGDGS